MFDDAKKEKKFNQVDCVNLFVKAMKIFIDENYCLTSDGGVKGRN